MVGMCEGRRAQVPAVPAHAPEQAQTTVGFHAGTAGAQGWWILQVRVAAIPVNPSTIFIIR